MKHEDTPEWAAAVEETLKAVFDRPGVMSATLSGSLPDSRTRWKRVSVRPIQLQDELQFQFRHFDGKRTETRNVAPRQARRRLEALLGDGYAEISVVTDSGDLHIRITRKGRVLHSRSKGVKRATATPQAHDREKAYPIRTVKSDALLQALGLVGGDGRVRPAMQGKFRQINEFLRILEADVSDAEGEIRLLDCGCGRAYLSFAAYVYLSERMGRRVLLTGVDSNAELIRKCDHLADGLGLSQDVRFVSSTIDDFNPDPAPDVVMSLHACDTATDDAIARGVRWRSRVILCAPCCQHDLQGGLKGGGPMRAVLRHGILRERQADLLADTFRSQILRILGYRVKVVEFVSPEATARNIMLRAERRVRPGAGDAIAEYLALRDLWGVTPYLETKLGDLLNGYLS